MKNLEAAVIFTKEQIEKWAKQDFQKIAIPIKPSTHEQFVVPVYILDEERENQDDLQQ